ncbi:MAG: GMC family oxidoreductase N-terminal domain-containing protein [Gemmatimonadaceae bacterium]
MTPRSLTESPRSAIRHPRSAATLAAVCQRLVPSAFEPGDGAVDLPALVAQRIEAMDPATGAQVVQALGIVGSALSALAFSGRPRRMTAMSPTEQHAWLASWELSRIPVRRTLFQALRRLVLSTYYAQPEAHRAIGYRGALWPREPELSSEGPVVGGSAAENEPVARISEALRVPMQSTITDERWHELNRVPHGVTLGSELGAETTLRADVCVVGSGAGGAVVAARFAERGLDVVLLEEGGYYTASDFTEDEGALAPRLYADQAMRATTDLSAMLLQGRSVGGGTTVNWMVMLRTPEWVLDEWADDHATEGMSASDLAPVFDLIERETHTATVPDDAHSPSNRAILDGARSLGWRAAAGRINASGCVRSGFCGIGCRYGAKQSTLVTFVPRALAAGARLYSDVRVDRIEIAERGGARPLKRVRATVLDRASSAPRGRVVVEAQTVVLSAGAVGTPTILQRSSLGNDVVGKYLRLHPTSPVIATYDRQMQGGAGIPLSAVCDEFLASDDGYGFWIECPPLYPALSSVAIPYWGEAHQRVMRQYARLGAMIVLVRDGADRDASNGAVTIDRKGRPKVAYRLGKADGRTLVRGIQAAARLHFAAGAQTVRPMHARELLMRSPTEAYRVAMLGAEPNLLPLFSAHVNGTCRLGGNARTSVCTPNGEVRGAPGVYVVDGSILPTALGVNPQETIMALATVLASRI